MPAIEILLATIQDERRRRMEEARLERSVTSSRPTIVVRLGSRLWGRRRRSQRDATRSPQPATGAGSTVS